MINNAFYAIAKNLERQHFFVACVIFMEHVIPQLSCFQGQQPHYSVVQILLKSLFFKRFHFAITN